MSLHKGRIIFDAPMLYALGFVLLFTLMLGYLGMPRRSYTYPAEWQSWNLLSSAGASILAVACVLPLFYLGWVEHD